jgi:CheY-like chemotaxis protein
MSAKSRILVVDDSAAIRSSVKNVLKPLHADVQEATNGQDGLAMALV